MLYEIQYSSIEGAYYFPTTKAYGYYRYKYGKKNLDKSK